MRSRPVTAAFVLSVLMVATGCGGESDAGSEVGSSTDPDGIVTISAAHWGVEYYGACGNETVVVDGVTYYPLLAEEQARLAIDRYPTSAAEQAELLGETDDALWDIQRVVAPGPGDDVGKMLIYIDGTARFESDSGRVLWLSAEPKTYEWDC